jgi:voltage-gated potassium channel
MSGHVIICGFGRTGRALTKILRLKGKEVVVVDLNAERRRDIEELGATFICGDADGREVLKLAGAPTAEALVACVGTDAENVYIALAAKQCRGDLRVLARASDDDAERIMKEATEMIDKVITPHESMGELIADELLHKVRA